MQVAPWLSSTPGQVSARATGRLKKESQRADASKLEQETEPHIVEKDKQPTTVPQTLLSMMRCQSRLASVDMKMHSSKLELVARLLRFNRNRFRA